MSTLSTHVLDTSLGKPAAGIEVTLEFQTVETQWKRVGHGTTNAEGRIAGFSTDPAGFQAGYYLLTFNSGTYFDNLNVDCFYPQVYIFFEITDAGQHYHVPLLLSPFGYSTYRGS